MQLRQLQEEDATQLFLLRTNTIVNKYIGETSTKSEKDALSFIQDRSKEVADGKIQYWAITLKNQEKLIGTICLWNYNADKTIAEIGYGLLPEYFRKGYMTEAIQEVIHFAFSTLQMQAVEAFTHKDNLSSRYLLEKNGFALEETRIDDGFPQNRIYTLKNAN